MKPVETALLLAVLLPAAWQDIQTKEVAVTQLAVLAIIGLIWNGIFATHSAVWYAAAAVPGLMLLFLSRMTGAIGDGDGFVFLAIGAIAGGAQAWALMTGALIVCFLGSLIYHTIGKMGWKERIPLVPFVLAVYPMIAV